MANIIRFMPELEGDELLFVDGITREMDESQREQFAQIYRARRKDPQTVLLLALLGFIIVAGVHRFTLGQIGMGLLYLFTGGLCLVGTIVDLVNYKKLSFEYNRKVAQEIAVLVLKG